MSFSAITEAGVLPLIGEHLHDVGSAIQSADLRDRARIHGDVDIGTRRIWITDGAEAHQANVMRTLRDLITLERVVKASDELRDAGVGLSDVVATRKSLLELRPKEGPSPPDPHWRWRYRWASAGRPSGRWRDLAEYE